MARVALIPKYVSINMEVGETLDLILTLRAAARDFGDSYPESMVEFLEQLEAAYGMDNLPQAVDMEMPTASTDDDEGGVAA